MTLTPEQRRQRKINAAKKLLGPRLSTHPQSTFRYTDSSGAVRSPALAPQTPALVLPLQRKVR